MIASIYKNAFRILISRPIKLWGLSLLNVLLVALVSTLGVLPIITIPATLTLTAGMSIIYLDGYHGKQVFSEQMFAGFKNFPHVAGGMCWKKLWVFIWGLIPVVGFIFAIVKSLSYAFTPYILLEKPNISATEALKVSMEKTKGYKGQMFVAAVLPVIAFIMVFIILALLAMIPFIGSLFATIDVLLTIGFALFINLFLGLVFAGFYDMAENSKPFYY
jgi:hypothetical protein